MLAEDVQQNWRMLEEKMTAKLGATPTLADILLQVGIRESCQPPRHFSDNEKFNLLQMAECTVLVPGRYYQLFWVEDNGWPHYSQLERLPQMTAAEKEDFLKPYILLYAEKNKIW